MVKIYSKRKVFSLKTINWADKSNLSQMKRSGQNILISLSCWQNDNGKFFFSQLGKKFGGCSNITREVDNKGKKLFGNAKAVFFCWFNHPTVFFFCWFNRPTVTSFFLLIQASNGQFFFFVCFVSSGIVVWTQIQLREREEKKETPMQMPKAR